MGGSIFAVLRGIFAVLAGYLFMAMAVIGTGFAISFVFPDALQAPGQVVRFGYVMLSLGYSLVFAVGGGYVTAGLANRLEIRHAAALGILTLILGLVSMIVQWGKEPLWYQIALIVVMPPAILLGGYLRDERGPAGDCGIAKIEGAQPRTTPLRSWLGYRYCSSRVGPACTC